MSSGGRGGGCTSTTSRQKASYSFRVFTCIRPFEKTTIHTLLTTYGTYKVKYEIVQRDVKFLAMCKTSFFEKRNELGELLFYKLVEFSITFRAMFVNIKKKHLKKINIEKRLELCYHVITNIHLHF